MKQRMVSFIACALLAAALLSACEIQTSQQASIEATLTMDALAAIVQSTLVAVPPAQPTSPPQAPSPTTTPVPPPAAETPTPTATNAPTIPQAVVSENTNCRTGPGTVYDLVYSALAGSQLTIVAGSTVPEYVIGEIPNKPGQTCWLWTKYATISGDTSVLPKQTPPPTPTPSVNFTLEYNGINSCVGWGIGFKLVNTGGLTLKSAKATVEDTDTSTTISQSSNEFDKHGGCVVDTAIPELDPGDKGYVYAYDFAYDPSGHKLKGTVTVCTQSGLGGQCSTRSVSFKP
ncbi:MAG: hypothetical protein MUO23_11185 [Anaerolineales bacterium]|nr:hypothetical protein [Anaerolineales bacterium]